MATLFLNYDANTGTLSINPFRIQGYVGDIRDLAENIARGISGSCGLEGAPDAIRDSVARIDTSTSVATTEILEMIDSAICDFLRQRLIIKLRGGW